MNILKMILRKILNSCSNFIPNIFFSGIFYYIIKNKISKNYKNRKIKYVQIMCIIIMSKQKQI